VTQAQDLIFKGLNKTIREQLRRILLNDLATEIYEQDGKNHIRIYLRSGTDEGIWFDEVTLTEFVVPGLPKIDTDMMDIIDDME
jgi:hypothetical protein